jgi:phenylalanyl-tRNA synthetase beta chain
VAAELDLDVILDAIPDDHRVAPVPAFPPVLEDLAVVVDDELTAEQVETVIRQAGKALVAEVRLFDMYRGEQVGPGKKSLAYSIVYQAPDRTLTDEEVAKIRKRIVGALDKKLKAKLRS